MRFFFIAIFGLILTGSEILFLISFIDYLADGFTLFTKAEEIANTSFLVGLAALIMVFVSIFGNFRWFRRSGPGVGRIYPTNSVGLISKIRNHLGE